MILIYILVAALCLIVLYDLLQKKHAILHNFPILGHFRYVLETVGPELRQYIVTSNNEERPFSRDQRRWVYASSKKQNDYFGFGSDNDMESSHSYLIIKPTVFSFPKEDPFFYEKHHWPLPCVKILGGYRNRKHAFRPKSVVNTSAMSFGSLSGRAIESINRGVKIAGCLQNTGEGGISNHHKKGGELIWQIGTGYFGCRDKNGQFSRELFMKAVNSNPVRAIEIKLSQGAKPGMGGVLPKAKISQEIAEVRGIPMDKDCISPSYHQAFDDVDTLLDFVEELAEISGLPVGIKSAVGDLSFWHELATQIKTTSRAVDFITIDGGEGGTGAAPLVFSDHVSLPFKMAFSRVYKIFAEQGIQDRVVFIGSGKLGFPEQALMAFAMGADMINVGREALLAVGCIQAMKCHTNHCPTGIATSSKWLARGLDPASKSDRLANYIIKLRKEIIRVCWSCGVTHPALIRPDMIEMIGGFKGISLTETFNYQPDWNKPDVDRMASVNALMQKLSAEEPPP